MPELPEVETVVSILKKQIIGETIEKIEVLWPNIVNTDIDSALNQTIQAITRRGKFIIIHLDNGYLVSHLRMEGKYYYFDEPYHNKHVHVRFYFANGKCLNYHDTRKFGRIDFVKDLCEHQGLSHLGKEVFDQQASVKWLYSVCKKRSIPIKSLLLDQSVVCGIGNIYANEILFECKIHPQQPANTLTLKQCQLILKWSQIVLTNAILMGGTTIDSFESSYHIHGLFQHQLKVHAKVHEACPVCQTEIKKIVVNQRGTYFCPKCQKLKKLRLPE